MRVSTLGVTYSALAYILGFTFGDGNISNKAFLVRLWDQNQEFVTNTLKQTFVDSFGVEPGLSFDKYNNSYVLHKKSKLVWSTLHDLGVPPGRKARVIVVPDSIKLADDASKASFVSGVLMQKRPRHHLQNRKDIPEVTNTSNSKCTAHNLSMVSRSYWSISRMSLGQEFTITIMVQS